MSLYNMLFGTNTAAPTLLKILNNPEVPRFRDCFLDQGFIVIHTRSGGGNREWLEAENELLTQHPNYSHDEDDEFDSTYANFYFTYPEEFKEDLEALAREDKDYKPSHKWDNLFKEMKDATVGNTSTDSQ